MADPVEPGVTAPPAEPAAPVSTPAAPAPSQVPSGSEPVINPGSDPEQTVPFSRFQEVNDKAKQAEEENTRLQQELEVSKQLPSTDDDLDPDVEEMIRKGAKKLGLVSKDELAANQSRIQVEQDIKELTATPPNPGIPYDNKAVMDYAKTNNMPITSKAALRAAYRELNYDKIVEAQRQSAIEGYRKAGSSGAEQPGSSGAVAPEEPELTSKTPKERTRERIRNARQKLTI